MYTDIMSCTNAISEAHMELTVQMVRAGSEGVSGAEAKLAQAQRLLEEARKLVIEAADCVPYAMADASADLLLAAE